MSNRMLNKSGARWAGSLLVVLTGLAVAAPAGAVPQIMTAYGDQMPWVQAEINAMGGSGTALYRGGLSNIYNPAFLSVETSWRLDAGFSLDQEHEDRFQPLFDTFNSWVTDAAIASNREHYWQTGFALAKRVLEGERPLSVGLSLTDRYPFQYRFWEELRNPSPFYGDVARDQVIERREREVTGTLRDLSLGVGWTVDDIFSVGAAAHYAFGTRKEVRTVRDYVDLDGDQSYNQVAKKKLDGVNFTLGVRGLVSERVELGLAWESQLAATGDLETTYYDAATDTATFTSEHAYLRYPNRYRAGLTFFPRTDPRTVFTIEVELVEWSEMADSEIPGYDNPQNFNDGKDVRIGLQHTFYNGAPLRFGFRHFDSYADKESTVSVFSTGVGVPYGDGMFSASVELSKVTGYLAHQFPYPDDYFGDQYEADPTARVEDTRFRFGVSYNVSF